MEMRCTIGGWILSALFVTSLTTSPARAAEPFEPAAPSEDGIRFFETKIRPLLATHCYSCHGEDEQESGLRLDSWQGLIAGGDSGESIRPGSADSSLLIAAVRYADPVLQMPPDGKLSDREITDLEAWIAAGAPHPDAGGTPPLAPISRTAGSADSLWSLQPMRHVQPPSVSDAAWVATPIDAFVRARLESAGLQPTPPADRRTLIRRATYDLTGLPPTPAEIEAFLADDAPDAYARLVDRLLASPAYGERWGRHWLDVARYADSNGLDENIAHGNAWRYRDWVVGAWNEDLPYDQFVQQQIAGDLLPADDPATRDDHLIATGYLALGPKVLAEADKQKMEMDIIDEQLDTLGRSFLGLTIGCARCHDHKFDPIRAADYYALAGIFKSTLTMDDFKTIARWHEHEIPTPEQDAARNAHQEQLAAQQQAVAMLVANANEQLRQQLGAGAAFPDEPEPHYPEATRQQLTALRERVAELEKSPPPIDSAMGVAEGEATDLAIHLRGSHLSLGDQVSRGFPTWIETSREYPIAADESGRLQLARWITDPQNPLTWRMIVNRVWRWHFGRGLVASVDNFGHLGTQPSHPELLDWLARRFASDGYSIKRLHRLIMLSNTYQTSSRTQSEAAEVDPENTLLWRGPLRRLEAESLRDALLAVSGQLDRRMGGSLLHVGNREFLFDHTSKDTTNYDSPLRSLYLPVIRNNLYDGFQLFDYTTAGVIAGDRSTTTVATQALFLMNSEFVQTAAQSLAEQIRQSSPDAADRASELYLRAVGRRPTPDEQTDLEQTLRQLSQLLATEPDVDGDTAEARAWTVVCHALLASNEFIYVR